AGTGNHASSEGRRVELMLGVQNERGVHGAHPGRGRLAPMQKVKEMTANRVILGFHVDALTVMAVVVPITKHGAEGGDQAIRDVLGTSHVVVVLFRQYAAQHRGTGA